MRAAHLDTKSIQHFPLPRGLVPWASTKLRYLFIQSLRSELRGGLEHDRATLVEDLFRRATFLRETHPYLSMLLCCLSTAVSASASKGGGGEEEEEEVDAWPLKSVVVQ